MTVYIKREDTIDAVLDVYYNTPDIDLSGERLEAARKANTQPIHIYECCAGKRKTAGGFRWAELPEPPKK